MKYFDHLHEHVFFNPIAKYFLEINENKNCLLGQII